LGRYRGRGIINYPRGLAFPFWSDRSRNKLWKWSLLYWNWCSWWRI